MRIPRAVERWGLGVVVLTILVSPLIIALRELRGLEWGSTFDFALFELRVREVGGPNTPLLGVPGRLSHDHFGCHPGPLAFYLLAPAYRLFGDSVLSLRSSYVILTTAAMATALVIAQRRAGRTGLVVVGLVYALLDLGFGLSVLTQFWNPHLAVPWFVTFLVAVWATVSGGAMYLPIAAACASLSAQAHISYAAACGGPLALAVGVVLFGGLRARRAGVASPAPRALLSTLSVLLVLWFPPLLEEWLHAPGNLARLLDYFRHPPSPPAGLGLGLDLGLRHLDPVHLTLDAFRTPGTLASFFRHPLPSRALGAASLIAWLGSAALARRLGLPHLRALHAVAAVSLVTSAVAISRIIGVAAPYLVYFAWVVGATVLTATVATAAALLRERLGPPSAGLHRLTLAGALLVSIAASVRLFTSMSAPVVADFRSATQLGSLARQTAGALLRNEGGATGREGRYLVTWIDALYGGGQGIGLVNELERRGFVTGVTEANAILFGRHRVMDERDATVLIHLVNGAWVQETKLAPGAVMVAHSDPRTPAERDEYMAHQALLAERLRKKGKAYLAERLPFDLRTGGELMGPGTPEDRAYRRMMDIGVPSAVFTLKVYRPE